MDTFINIIGLASFIYLFIYLGVKAFNKKNTPPPALVTTTITAQVHTRLCATEYEGIHFTIFRPTLH
mgnify:CR=1 FL=1